MPKIVQMLCKSMWCTSRLQVSSQSASYPACSMRPFKVERNYNLICRKIWVTALRCFQACYSGYIQLVLLTDPVLYKIMDIPTKKVKCLKKMDYFYPSFSYTRNAPLSNLIIISKLYFMSWIWGLLLKRCHPQIG